MKKLVQGLNIKSYDEVEDILFELLADINIVKLGEEENSLKHLYHDNQWSEDITVSESYIYATYYRLDKLNDLINNHLTGSWSETYTFNKLIESMK